MASQEATPIQSPAVKQELRFAVTMNGGVSLAVYIGGVAQELNSVTKAYPVPALDPTVAVQRPDSGPHPYRSLLDLLGYTPPVIDVITGTSAGGINAAALAVAQANVNGDIAMLKPLWLQDAQIEAMLRKPFQKSAPSLMKGDEYFLPLLQQAFRQMTEHGYIRAQRDIDLTIPTTLLTPWNERSRDELGTRLVEGEFAGLFNFPGPENSNEERVDQFSEEKIKDTAQALALAARASAGFPVAFEPTFIPVNDNSHTDRPDMAAFANWTPKTGEPASRYAVDGGVLNNTPTRPALAGIQRREASGMIVRRVLVLVHPHALDASTVCDTADETAKPPTLLKAIQGVAKAATSVGSKSYVDEIDASNRRALRWRDGRTVALERFASWADLQTFLDSTPGHAWKLFRSMRIQRNAYIMANAVRREDDLRLVRLADNARRFLEKKDDTVGLPHLSKEPPAQVPVSHRVWPWGVALATGVMGLMSDLLRELNRRIPRENTAFQETVSKVWSAVINDQIKIDTLGEQLEKAASMAARDSGGGLYERFNAYLDVYRNQLMPDLAETPGSSTQAGLGTAVTAEQGPDDWVGAIVADYVSSSVREFFTKVVKELPDQFADRVIPGKLGKELFKDVQNADDLLQRLLSVEVVSYLVSENADPGFEERNDYIELVQLSAQVPQHFAEGFNSDDKLAGMSLGRFGAFIKRSWRANDWIWGRLDAAKTIMLVLLTSEAIRRLAKANRDKDEWDQAFAAQIVDAIGRNAFGNASTYDALKGRQLFDLCQAANGEVWSVLQNRKAGPLPFLASLAAYGPQMAIAYEEMPSLRDAIAEDKRSGAVGARAERLLDTLDGLRFVTGDTTGLAGYRQLILFRDAGIGREELSEQLPSDALIRTANTAVATTASVLGSERSGLGLARGPAAAIRGFVGLPYWALSGLTHRGQLARLGAAVLLALGVSLVAISLVAPLSGFLAGLLPVLGFGSLLALVAYGALRTQSVVHVAALLGLFIPLVTLGLYQTGRKPAAGAEQDTGANFLSSHPIGWLSIGCIAVLVVGTIVVANLTSPLHSPISSFLAGLNRIGKLLRRNIPETSLTIGLAVAGIVLWRTSLATAIWGWVVGLVDEDWREPISASFRGFPFSPAVYVGIVLVGCAMAFVLSFRLRPASAPALGATTKRRWRRLTDPAGLAIAWSAIYGAIYVALTLLLVGASRSLDGKWAWVPAAISLTLGALFSLVAVPLIWVRAKGNLIKRLADQFADKDPFPPANDDPTVIAALKTLGANSRYLFKNDGAVLSWRGNRVASKARRRWKVEYQPRRQSLRTHEKIVRTFGLQESALADTLNVARQSIPGFKRLEISASEMASQIDVVVRYPEDDSEAYVQLITLLRERCGSEHFTEDGSAPVRRRLQLAQHSE